MRSVLLPFTVWLVFLLPMLLASPCRAGDPIRVGIIGLDTSHVIAFTSLLNDPKSPDHVPGAQVVAGYPGGSPDNPSSASRVDEYTRKLAADFHVEIVKDIPALCAKVDAVLLESVDGRPHLEQLRPVIAARKPVFIDKPLAGSIGDAREIARLVKESGVPCFSSSSLRFFPGVTKLRGEAVGEILGCDAYSPCATEEHHPDLYWYGVHGVEILFTLMGAGCESVTRVSAPDYDLAVGRWKDGRIGTFRGIRKGAAPFGATVFGTKGMMTSDPVDGSLYRHLVLEIVKFFKTGVAPVPLEETVEIHAFMSAADESKRRGGRPVKLSELLAGKPAEATEVGPREAIEARPGRKGLPIRISSGEIPALELVRFLADTRGLPAICDVSVSALAERTITVAAPIERADEHLVKKLLEANHLRVTEAASGAEGRVILIESTDAPAGPEEPRARPIVVVGDSARREPAGRGTAARRARGPESTPERFAGIALEEVPEVVRAQVDLVEGRGVLVAQVDEGVAAGRRDLAALRLHDVITHVNDAPIDSAKGFVSAVNALPPGDAFQIRVLRKGATAILRCQKN